MTHLIIATALTPRVVVGVLAAGLVLGALGMVIASTKEKSPPETAGAVSRAAIPPIDAAAPTHTETATFALG